MSTRNNVNNWKSSRPQLKRQNAIAPPIYNEDEHITNIELIDFNTLQIYSNKYSYTNYYSRMVIDGYTNTQLPKYIPSDINTICFKYYFSSQTSIFAIAYKLWNKYQNKQKKHKKFTGYNLISQLLDINKNSSNKLIRNQFIDLIDNKYIEPTKNNLLYKFTANSIIEFQEYRQYLQKYDRQAWNIGTEVEIKSCTYKTWVLATIISIKNVNNITVVFRKNNNIIKKTVNRYDYKSIKSTNQFINNRKSLNINDRNIQIYDGYNNKWYSGLIKNIINNKYNEMLYVEYKKEMYDCVAMKIVNRWSSEYKIKRENKYSEQLILNKYKKGNHCNVWSISQNNWVSAVIKMIIPNLNCILVKYDGYQKIIDVANNNNIVLS
eukprot:117212_1